MSVHRQVTDLIGNTPMIEVRGFDRGPCRLLLKLESQNPGGSIKDRIGRSMIEAAERDGRIKPGSTLVEATAGNTGLGLALVAAAKGYRLILVIPDKMSQEKLAHLRALGAEIVLTRSDVGRGHPQYYQDLAEKITADTPNAWYVNQFNNPANPLAHETTTAPEIWRQTEGKVDAIVCGVGSGGTLTGMSRYFERIAPQLELVLADPTGSVLAEYVRTGKIGSAGSWLVEGIGEDFVPPVADLSRVTRAYSISDREAMTTARKLLRSDGILAGSSSGTLLAAALRYCREQTRPKTVVTFVCDTGNKYLGKMFNENWLNDQGLGERPAFGDLRDLISRSTREGEVVAVGPEDPLTVVFTRMKMFDVSQLPVLDASRVVGIVDESDLLLAVYRDRGAFERSVSEVMTTRVRSIDRRAGLDDLMPIFDAGLVAVVNDDEGFHGLITRIDVLNFLRSNRQRQKQGEKE